MPTRQNLPLLPCELRALGPQTAWNCAANQNVAALLCRLDHHQTTDPPRPVGDIFMPPTAESLVQREVRHAATVGGAQRLRNVSLSLIEFGPRAPQLEKKLCPHDFM